MNTTHRSHPLHALAGLGLALCSLTAMAAPALVTVENQTHPTACAEEDNVSLTLSGERGIARFRVEALQPDYLAAIDEDITAPDFSNCNFDGGAHPTDPRFDFKPRRVVLHDGPRWQIVGITLPSFWRPNQVPVRLGKRSFKGIHMLQVFAKTPRKPLEAVVMYPADGYWRLKPLPPARFKDGVYGSSFVMGPVEQDRRPVANIVSMDVQVEPLVLRLRFADGSAASARVAEISETRTALDVSMTPARAGKQPFAVLRSMYVAPDNADMSEVRWQATPQAPVQAAPLPEVSTLQAVDVRFGRSLPSRHNTSAPDIRFGSFYTAP